MWTEESLLSKVHILLYTISRRLAKRHRGFYRFSSKKVGKEISSDNKYNHSKYRVNQNKSLKVHFHINSDLKRISALCMIHFFACCTTAESKCVVFR